MSERNATRTVPSVCRFCHAGCAILVDIERRDGQDRLVRVRGDRDNPVYRGFTCEKGRQLPEQHHHPDRLLRSMRKRPDGTHEPIAGAEAISEIAARLGAIIAAHGPRSVAYLHGHGGQPQPCGPTLAQCAHGCDRLADAVRLQHHRSTGQGSRSSAARHVGSATAGLRLRRRRAAHRDQPVRQHGRWPSDARPHATRS